ncbi:hypothetical protein [Paenibacillus polymyxa]|uniref:hypothetical protein n=1 Tax=Paenibacillus polymyxa TaxID=1406 RepID=UPI003D2A4CEA
MKRIGAFLLISLLPALAILSACGFHLIGLVLLFSLILLACMYVLVDEQIYFAQYAKSYRERSNCDQW